MPFDVQFEAPAHVGLARVAFDCLTATPNVVPVPLQVLRGEPHEYWTAAGESSAVHHGRIAGQADGHWLFGQLQVSGFLGPQLEALVARAYAELYDAIDALGYPHMLRIWNYMSHINRGAGDDEVYKRFCVGRAQGIANRTRGDAYPAATAIGGADDADTLHISFIAGTAAGEALENPRQVSAFRYPRQYGPSSPSFARANVVTSGGQRVLLASGTASVAGHETRWPGDVAAQVRESVLNLQELVAVAGGNFARTRPVLRIYLRDAGDADLAEHALQPLLPTGASWVLLRGDICRSDLLVEIDGVFHLPLNSDSTVESSQ